jgi:uncharacterized protein (DUF1015 family)
MKIYPFQAFIPVAKNIKSPGNFVSSVKESFLRQIEEGNYKYFDEEKYYIYNIKRQGFESMALVALVNPDPQKIEIIPHEATTGHKKDILLPTILEEKVMTKPIMTFSDDHNLLNGLVYLKSASECMLSLDLGVEGIHEIFQINSGGSQVRPEKLLESIKKLYIADGHHRLEVLHEIKKDYNPNVKMLLSIFPKLMLQVKGYNRQIAFGDNFRKAELMMLISQYGEIVPSDMNEISNHNSGIYMQVKDTFYKFCPDRDLPIFEHLYYLSDIMDKIFSFANQKLTPLQPILTNSSYEFDDGKAIFYLPPVTADTIISETEAGKLFPPKSTWFEPKVRSGLIAGKILGNLPT